MAKLKIFKDLEKEIIEPNICSLCGGCVSVCAITKINAIEIINDKPTLVKSDDRECYECGLCYQICPRTSALSKELDEEFSSTDPIGSHKKLTWAQTNDSELKKVCQDGGVVTSILKYLFDTKRIDGAIVNIPQSDWNSVPVIITSSDQLKNAAGTRYSVTPLLEAFQKPKIYTSPKKIEDVELSQVQSLMKLNKFEYARLAFVGCPCHVQSIKKMNILNIRPAITIKYVIGLFCMENFNYSDLMKKKIEKELKIKIKNVQKLNIKKNFLISVKDKPVVEVPLKDMDDVIRSNCLFCPDFSSLYADIAVGGIGAPKNNSVVVIRTETGENLFEDALSAGYITEYDESEDNMSKLNVRSVKIINRMTKMKGERAKKKRST